MLETFSGNIYIFFPMGKKLIGFLPVGLAHSHFRNISNAAYDGGWQEMRYKFKGFKQKKKNQA